MILTSSKLPQEKVKMLHELKRGEWGSLILSSCMFPRYEIGDLIEAAGKNYYRVFGRKKVSTLLEHGLYRSVLRWIIYLSGLWRTLSCNQSYVDSADYDDYADD